MTCWTAALAAAAFIRIVDDVVEAEVPVAAAAIMDRAGVRQSTVRHHLKILAEARFADVGHKSTSSP